MAIQYIFNPFTSNFDAIDVAQSPLTTKGDIYTYSTTDTALPVGTDGQIIIADSTQSTGLRWAGPNMVIYELISTQAVGANGIIKFDNAKLDPNTDYNTTTGEWTCPSDGVYQINITGISISGTSNVLVYINNTSNRYLTTFSTAQVSSGTVALPLTAGNTVSYVLDAGATLPGIGGITYFCSMFISEVR